MSAATVPATLLECRGVPVVDTFAEAFPMTGLRLVVTAASERWARIAAAEFCGNATSVIACDMETAVERSLSPDDTPDLRPGVSILAFGFSRDALGAAVAARVGQCILTAATTACWNGILDAPKDKQVSVGGRIRYFGDGFQGSKKIGGRRLWRIPVMDGEFVCEDRFGTLKGVGGGNLLIGGKDQASALAAAEAAVEAAVHVPDVVLPFPGGLVRSGSKVGSRYKGLKASTNDAYCPVLRDRTATELTDDTGAVYEIVVDGLSFDAVQNALRAALHAACGTPGVTLVTAGNYGGKLGPHHFALRDLL